MTAPAASFVAGDRVVFVEEHEGSLHTLPVGTTGTVTPFGTVGLVCSRSGLVADATMRTIGVETDVAHPTTDGQTFSRHYRVQSRKLSKLPT